METKVVVDQFTKELKVSGYTRAEIVVSGLIGWKRKMRSAKSTLASRCKKKLVEKTSWYKKKRDEEEDGEDEIEKEV